MASNWIPRLMLRPVCCSLTRLFITVLIVNAGFLLIPEVTSLKPIVRPLNVTFDLGRDASLTCSVGNIGDRTVIWRRLSEPFPLTIGTTRFWPGKKYRIHHSGDQWQLVIKNVQHFDAGEYECRVSGQGDNAEILSLIIRVAGSGHTHLLPSETTVKTLSGNDVLLPCHVNNLRNSVVMWQNEHSQVLTLRKKRYSGDKRHRVVHTQRDQWSLSIQNVKDSDYGVYTCVVNSDPILTRTVRLLEGKPQEGGSDDTKLGQSRGGGPELVQSSFRDKVMVPRHSNTTLTCQYMGDPTPTIKWERISWDWDGNKLIEDLETHGETYTLTNAQPQDSALYVCKANNGVPPPVQARIRVEVTDLATSSSTTQEPFNPREEGVPHVYTGQGKIVGSRGGVAEFYCSAMGNPIPTITWRRNGTKLDTSHFKYEISNNIFGSNAMSSMLKVNSLQSLDFTQYECEASNRIGSSSQVICLTADKKSVC